MKAIIDNNLPATIGRRVREIKPGADIVHLIELGLQDRKDQELREHWRDDPIIWISRDEDFWLDSPQQWAVVWVSCHNPRLAFLRDKVAPAIATHLDALRPGVRLLITEDIVCTL